MVMHVSGEQVLARIGFAERWLHRAKEQCVEGNVARSVLTLVLADAEMHHAMEVAGVTRRSAARRGIIARALAAITIAVGVAAAVSMLWSARADSVSFDQAPPVVRLASPGDLLLAVSAAPPTTPISAGRQWGTVAPPPPVAAATAASSAVKVPGTVRVANKPRVSQQVSPDFFGTLPAPAGTSSGVTARVTAPQLSMGDVIDLVLAAERTLRSEPISLLSP